MIDVTEENLYIEDIDWSLIDPEQFEKLIYFLLDSIGMKNIIWRKGGSGVSATDSGRDLEFEDHVIGRDDSVRIEKWWIEVKYRSNTLEKTKVQETLINAIGFPNLNVIGIATNNVITNPTRDWIENFKEQHKDKRIVIWEGHKIEKIINDHPTLVYRFFPSSLTLKGRFNIIHARFHSYLQLPSGTDLINIWENRESLDFSPKIVLPIILAEATFGDLGERQWGFWIKKDLLLATLIMALINTIYLSKKCEDLGKDTHFLMEGMEYLLLSNFLNFPADIITENIVINFIEGYFKDKQEKPEFPYKLIQKLLEPIISNICFNLIEICCNNSLCNKVIVDIDARNKYINRYIPKKIVESSINKNILIIQSKKEICRFNIETLEGNCPLMENKDNIKISDKNTLLKTLQIIQKVFTELRDTIFRLS